MSWIPLARLLEPGWDNRPVTLDGLDLRALQDAAARLVQDEVAQGLVRSDEARLRPERLAGRRCDAADDDIAHLALGMAGDDLDGPA